MRRYRGKKGKGHQETCIKYPWTKPKGGRIESGRWGRAGKSGSGKMETSVFEHQYKMILKKGQMN